jgi:ribulose-phosphate 3-epimerase
MEYQLAGRPQQLSRSDAPRHVVDTPPTSTSRQRFARLRAAAPLVVPSMLLCDFAHLADEIRQLEEAGVPALHLDVMDGHFVPNLSYGLPIVEAVRRVSTLPIEAHLMISRPDRYAAQFVAAGADAITFHLEALDDPRPLLLALRGLGAVAGLAYNPDTPVAAVEPYLDACDSVLTMSVMPGFGGQAFERVALDNLRRLHAIAGERVLLEVDGGINADTIGPCADAGAKLFVAGSAIFKHPPYTSSVAALVRAAQIPARTH